MRPAKEQWIYAGLAVPVGVVLVRRPQERVALPVESTIALCGGKLARPLAVPLGVLARGAGAKLRLVCHPGWSAADWAADATWPVDLAALSPAAVLFVLSARDPLAVATLSARARGLGARVRWLPPPGERARAPEAVPAPLYRVGSGLSVGSYAGWAGAAWRSLAEHSAPRR